MQDYDDTDIFSKMFAKENLVRQGANNQRGSFINVNDINLNNLKQNQESKYFNKQQTQSNEIVKVMPKRQHKMMASQSQDRLQGEVTGLSSHITSNLVTESSPDKAQHSSFKNLQMI